MNTQTRSLFYWIAIIFATCAIGLIERVGAQESTAIVETAAERQERIIAERFLELLKKRPRMGTALDKLYGYHASRGTLDALCDSLQAELKDKASGESALLLGLVQMQRGQDAEARVAFEQAEEILSKEPLASFYLGKSLIVLGEVDKGAAAFERAIERKPAKAELLQIFQELGRVYQRTRRTTEAMAVWQRMEAMFPGDFHVQEQIASILADEGANEAALERFASLSKLATDRFRKLELAVRAAQLKMTLGRNADGLRDFEELLGQVNPTSWLYQDIRRRIDDSFTNRSDHVGLTEYYTGWMQKHPEDVDAMMRVGRLLSIQRRTPEAKKWFAQAIDRAPSEPGPRLALVDALQRDGEYAAAAEAMQALCEKIPNNADYLVRWGELILENRQLPESERSTKAATVWRKLLDRGNDDPVQVARVADLMRRALLSDEAIELYRKAIELAENEPQYREYLGEYLHQLGRKEDALAVWRDLASGPRETRDNLVRLSEVLFTFQYREEALATLSKAVAMKPTFGQRMRYIEKLRDAEKFDDAFAQLRLASQQAEGPDEVALVVDQEVKCYQASGGLAARIAELEDRLAGPDAKSTEVWLKLALCQEADNKFQQASQSARKASELSPQSVAVHTIAARVEERGGLFGDAIASLRKLLALDRRFVSNYLTKIASMHMRLGETSKALATAQELLSMNSANTEQFRFYADLCFQAGLVDQGLDALRRNLRGSPNDREAILLLARSLYTQFKTEEASELYWRAFDRATTFDEKRSDVEVLSELYMRTNRFEQLIARLNNYGREENRQREATLLSAAANQATGDLGAARGLLEPLLREDSRDADLLSTMVRLAQLDNDWEAASNYQKRLNEIAPSPEGNFQLAKFLVEQGELDEVELLWQQFSGKQATAENVAQTVENLINRGDNEKAIAVIDRALESSPDNWEILSLASYMFWRCEQPQRAMELAQRVLRMNLPLDTLSESTINAKAKQAARPSMPTPISSLPPTAPAAFVGSTALTTVSQQQTSTALSSCSSRAQRLLQPLVLTSSRNSTAPGSYPVTFTFSMFGGAPYRLTCFGDAKMIAASLLWMDPSGRAAYLQSLRQKSGTLASPSSEAKPLENNPGPTIETDMKDINDLIELQIASGDMEGLWSAYTILFCQSFTQVSRAQQAGMVIASRSTSSSSAGLLKRLSELGDTDAQQQLLATQFSKLRNRWMGNSGAVFSSGMAFGGMPAPPQMLKPPALGREELDELAKLLDGMKVLNQTELYKSQHMSYGLLLAKEYKLSGLGAEAEKYVEAGRTMALEKPTPNLIAELLTWDPDSATKAMSMMLEAQAMSATTGTASAAAAGYTSSVMLFHQLAERQEMADSCASLVGQLKNVQVAQAKKLRPSQLAAYKSATPSYFNFLGSNNQFVRLQIDFPSPSALQSSELLYALRLMQQSRHEKIRVAVAESLAKAAETADEDVMVSAVDRLCYATWLWWSDQKPAAAEQMDALRKLGVATDLATVIQSRMSYELQRLDEAIALLDSLKPLNQQMLQDRELALLQMLLQTGDLARARQSAERLFSLQLPIQTQMQLGELMNQLGMREMADSMMERTRRRSGNDLGVQMQLMQKYIAQKNNEAASEIARQILRRTRPNANITNSVGMPSSMGGFPASARTPEAAYRQQAISVLSGGTEIKGMIENLEKRIEKSPKSREIITQLAELYSATGAKAKAQELLSRLAVPVKKPSNSNPQSLVSHAQALSSAGKHKEAVEQYLLAFEKQPELQATQVYIDFVKSVDHGSLWSFVAQQLSKGDSRRLASNPRMQSFTMQIFQNAAPNEAREFLHALLKAGPVITLARSPLVLTQAVDRRIPNEQTAEIVVDKVCEELRQSGSSQMLWSSRINTPKGYVRGALDGISLLLAQRPEQTKRMLEFVGPLRDSDKSLRSLESALLFNRGEGEKAAASARSLIDPETQHPYDGVNVFAVWELAANIAVSHKQYDLAAELVRSLNDTQVTGLGLTNFDYSPEALLLYCYEKSGKRDLAKALLDRAAKNLKVEVDASSSASYYIQNTSVLGQHYCNLDLPFEGLRLIEKARSAAGLSAANSSPYMQSSGLRQLVAIESQLCAKVTPALVGNVLDATLRSTNQDDKSDSQVAIVSPSMLKSKQGNRASQTNCLLLEMLDKIRSDSAVRGRLDATLVDPGVDIGQQSTVCLICRLCVADLLNLERPLVSAARELAKRLQIEKDSSDAIDPAAIWIAIDKLAARKEKDLAFELATLATEMQGTGSVGTLQRVESHMRMARLRLQLGQPDKLDSDLMDALDILYPPRKP